MPGPFDALAGIRRATKAAPTFQSRPRVVAGPSLVQGLDFPDNYTREPIYRAERRTSKTISSPYILQTVEEMQTYADAVLSRAYPTYSRAPWPVTFRDGNTPGVATHQAGIVLVPGPIPQLTLLHELAHHLAGTQEGHSPVWLSAFTFLIDQEMGTDISSRLLYELTR